MHASTLRRLALVLAASSVAVAAACSDDAAQVPITGAGVDADAATDAAPTTSEPASEAAAPDSTVPTRAVTFSYRPSWKGVKSVEVLGAFGQVTDWTLAFVTLTDDGTGTFTATAPAVAVGHHLYVFKVRGDEAAGGAAKADTLERFAIDPSNPAFVVCPEASPASSASGNPCSDLTVPQPAAAPVFHARGVVQSAGAPIAGYLVELERDEPQGHHMFANRTTTKADGTFDLAAAPGTYRFEVLHPTFYKMTDAQRTNPETFAAVRRSISSEILIDADTMINAAEVSYTGYAAMSPRGTATLPTSFSFTAAAGTKARAAVYGPGNQIGDPWWVGTATSNEFDGGFNTSKAPDGGAVKAAATYAWGTQQTYPKPDGGALSWTAQSMVLPIQWP